MKKNLSFETPQVESSFGTGVFMRNLDIIKISIYFHIIISIFKIYSESAHIHWLISILRIIISFIVFSICLAILNLNKLETNYNLRLFLQIDNIINILIKTKICYGNQINTTLNKIFNDNNKIYVSNYTNITEVPQFYNYSIFNNNSFYSFENNITSLNETLGLNNITFFHNIFKYNNTDRNTIGKSFENIINFIIFFLLFKNIKQ